MKPVLKPEVKEMWLRELRSGARVQGQGLLRDRDERYCCLGVLCEIAVQNNVIPEPEQAPDGSYLYGEPQHGASLPLEVAAWAFAYGVEEFGGLGYWDSKDRSLADMNDAGQSFEAIADLIEEKF